MIDAAREDGREFAVAYYRWALDQWHQEVEFGFPLLRAVRNPTCQTMFRLLKSRSRDEAIRTAQLLTKRFHPEAAELLNERLRPEELEFLDRLDRHRQVPPRATVRPRLSRSLLKKNVREAVSSILGTDCEKTSSEWCYTSTIGRWPVRTIIHFAGGDFNMSYQHDIVRGPEEWRVLAGYISAPAWLGVTSSGDWTELSDDDVPGAAAGLAFVCRRFFEALPVLLPK